MRCVCMGGGGGQNRKVIILLLKILRDEALKVMEKFNTQHFKKHYFALRDVGILVQ